MGKIIRTLFLTVLLALTLFILGSARAEKVRVAPPESETVAGELGNAVPQADQAAWRSAAKRAPLWLIRVTSY